MKFIKPLLIGLFVGFGVGIMVYFQPDITIRNTSVFYVIAGAAIGAIWGIVAQARMVYEQKRRQRWVEEEREQKEEEQRKARELINQKEYAAQVKRKSVDVSTQYIEYECLNIRASLSPNYEAAFVQEKIWDALHKAYAPLQQLADIVAEIS
jgi:hypothetical protein